MAAITRALNHGAETSARRGTLRKRVRVMTISSAARWHSEQAAKCCCCAGESAEASEVGWSSRESRRLVQSFDFFVVLSTFHIRASLLLTGKKLSTFHFGTFSTTISRHSTPVFAFSRLINDAASGTKQANLHGIGIEIQNFGNFFDGKAFDFFQDKHHAIPFI